MNGILGLIRQFKSRAFSQLLVYLHPKIEIESSIKFMIPNKNIIQLDLFRLLSITPFRRMKFLTVIVLEIFSKQFTNKIK